MRAALAACRRCCAPPSRRAPAHAQTGPVIVIPGKAGVPLTINGVIVDGAVVYGDWGLARPGHGELVDRGAGRLRRATGTSRGDFPRPAQAAHRPPGDRAERVRAACDEFPSRLVYRFRLQYAGHRISAVRSAAVIMAPRGNGVEIIETGVCGAARPNVRGSSPEPTVTGSVKQCQDVPSISALPPHSRLRRVCCLLRRIRQLLFRLRLRLCGARRALLGAGRLQLFVRGARRGTRPTHAARAAAIPPTATRHAALCMW